MWYDAAGVRVYEVRDCRWIVGKRLRVRSFLTGQDWLNRPRLHQSTRSEVIGEETQKGCSRLSGSTGFTGVKAFAPRCERVAWSGP